MYIVLHFYSAAVALYAILQHFAQLTAPTHMKFVPCTKETTIPLWNNIFAVLYKNNFLIKGFLKESAAFSAWNNY